MDLTQYEALLSDAETRLDRLRALYEQFFLGMERAEPTQLRKDYERIVVTLRKEQPRNSALRFRFQQLVQRQVTLENHWRKVLRQIEDGTYRRDLLRARRRRQGRTDVGDSIPPQVHEIDLTMDVDGALDTMLGEDASDYSQVREPVAPLPPPSPSSPPPARALSPFATPSLRPSQPPPAPGGVALSPPRVRPSQRPAASKSFHPPKPDALPAAPRVPTIGGVPARPAPPPPPRAVSPATPARPAAGAFAGTSAGGNYSEQQLRSLYDRYVSARRNNNERIDNVKLESLQKTVEAMLPKLREKHAGKAIDFDVVVRDGKVALKPVTK